MEIAKMLTISTAHITKETADKLNYEYEDVTEEDYYQNSFCFNTGITIYLKDVFGWFICIPDATILDESAIPDDLRDCLSFALKNGCDWLCLDCDGETVDELPTFEWEE